MKQYAVIVAGGSGTRMGGGIPKQFRSLCGRPVLWWSMKAFHEEDPSTEIIVVLPAEFIGLWKDFYCTLPMEEQFPHSVSEGGNTRADSVKNGLAIITDEEESLVAVHDGARPLLNKCMIRDGWKNAEVSGSAIPVVPVTDSLRMLKDSGGSKSIDRSLFVAVQTPQVFRTALLKEAYAKARDKCFTDDASVVEAAGCPITLIKGSPDNLKITNPKDMVMAAVLIGKDD